MAIPAYLWLKDDGGALIKGGVDVQHRECSIEVKGFHHNLMIPTDNATGKITGTRIHSPMLRRVRISTLRNENETFSQLNSITYIGVFLRLVTYSHLP
ncbi:type VI secretion system tube protein Hcp [Enterobacter kobei]|uniref:type VI secretion system tube protein Hcp n=1 Tax=Enterobacter kobei TaxID=208224 RepID=UPI002FFBC451